MQKITEDLLDLELYFRQTSYQNNGKSSWFTRWLYIPVEERMQILNDLLMPYQIAVQRKK